MLRIRRAVVVSTLVFGRDGESSASQEVALAARILRGDLAKKPVDYAVKGESVSTIA
ncbi:hypothetical protein AGRA3207_005544 [Actinomadura graeca]|uniref:Uncharacterized protein n=1 Tax=Actinomadura graeca TaxID=2750812 RepID=A0ABX8QZS9_9ACTN|nr:hypothetical protein [Actinomadura graeca]QXJ24260.1 hypothetical protein AGRA3207_005544 [Actinomadura graeca]